MKKIMVLLFLVIVVSFVSYFGYKSIVKHHINMQLEKSIQKLPVFSFYRLNGQDFSYNHSKKIKTLIIYFHPNCEHCQYEVKQLIHHKSKLVHTNILLISPASLTEIKQFQKDYQLEEISNLNLLWDKDQKFEAYFGTAIFPTVLIYNQNEELQEKYTGEVKIEAIIKHVNTPIIEKQNTISSLYTNKTEIDLLLFLFDLGR